MGFSTPTRRVRCSFTTIDLSGSRGLFVSNEWFLFPVLRKTVRISERTCVPVGPSPWTEHGEPSRTSSVDRRWERMSDFSDPDRPTPVFHLSSMNDSWTIHGLSPSWWRYTIELIERVGEGLHLYKYQDKVHTLLIPFLFTVGSVCRLFQDSDPKPVFRSTVDSGVRHETMEDIRFSYPNLSLYNPNNWL